MAIKRQPWSSEQQAWIANALRSSGTMPSLRDDVIAGNEGDRRVNSGIFGDLFDILSRPSSAVASGVLASQKGEDVLSAVGKALAGRERHNFSDVLGEAGVTNPVARAVGGFVGDVALDPLTYVGIKGEKGVNLTEATSQAVRQISQAESRVGGRLLGDAVAREAARLQAQNPSHLYVTFAGRKVTPDFVRPSEVGNVVKDAIIGPPTARRGIARAFSIESELPEGLAAKSRVYESSNQALFEDHKRAIGDVFNDLTTDERQRITRALEAGEGLDAVPLQTGVQREGMNTLGDYQKLARKLFDDYFDDEVAMGIRKPAEKADNYIYKFFRGGVPEDQPGLSRVATARLEGVPQRNTLKEMSLEQAERMGFDPLTDIGEILTERSAAHYRQIGRAQLVTDAIKTFGVKLDDEVNGQYLLNNNWRDASTALGSKVAKRFQGENMYLPEHIVRSLNQTEHLLTDNQLAGEFTRWYDKLTQKWKFLNTVVNPGYWVRNSVSDGIQNFMDGVRNPRYYDQAFNILKEHRTNTTEELLGRVTGRPAQSVTGKKIRLNGVDYDAHQIHQAYLQSGAKSGQIQTEIQPALNRFEREGIGKYIDVTKQAGAAGVGGFKKAELGLADANNYREDVFRMAHFLSAMEDELPKVKNWDTAVSNAGARVRKFNIDYGSLSSFERNRVRRVVPFYGWMRRNLPLQLQLLFTRPGYMAAYPKGQDLMQGLLGTDNGEGDYMIPKWIRESMPVRIAMGNNKTNNPIDKLIRFAAGAKGDDSVFLPLATSMTPVGDLTNITKPIQAGLDAPSPGVGVAEFLKSLAGVGVNQATPFVKAPVELATGRNLYTGAPIDNWGQWLGGQVAPGRFAENLAGGDRYGVTSALTGIQAQPVTEARQKSEFRRREDVLQGMSNRYSGTRALQWKNYLSQARRSVGA